jgi:hypothetical protein
VCENAGVESECMSECYAVLLSSWVVRRWSDMNVRIQRGREATGLNQVQHAHKRGEYRSGQEERGGKLNKKG